jgi:hypothetical protein
LYGSVGYDLYSASSACALHRVLLAELRSSRDAQWVVPNSIGSSLLSSGWEGHQSALRRHQLAQTLGLGG